MSDTTTLRRPATGWTVADAAPRVPRPSSRARVQVTVDADDLAQALSTLADGVTDGTAATVRTTPGGLEITVATDDHAYWETAVLPVESTTAPVQGAGEIRRLAEVASQLAHEQATIAIGVTGRGRLRLDGVDLPAVDDVPAPPARPDARGIVEQRVELPAGLPDGVPIRLAGLAITLPAAVRRRFTRRGVTMVSLYQTDQGWYLSGIAQGRPMYVLAGQVAVY